VGRTNELITTVAELYEAAVQPAGLSRLAEIVAGALDTDSGFLGLLARPGVHQNGTPNMVGLPSATANFDDWARTAYAEHYHGCNLWFERGIKRGFPAVVLGDELASSDELLRSEWYEYCRQLDAFHVIGAQFHVNDAFSAQFGAHRPRRRRAFNESSRQMMQVLLPHLQRSIQLQMRLGLSDQIRALTLDLFERAGVGVLILDRQMRLLFANSLAERLLDNSSGLRVANGRVSVARASAVTFERMVARAAQTSSGEGLDAGGMLTVGYAPGKTLRLLVSPLPRDGFGAGSLGPAVMVLAADDQAVPAWAPEQLQNAFGLTRAEALLLAALVTGESVSDHARRLGISVETARTHLKHVLNKTGHHRQVDLVRTVLADPLLRFGSGAGSGSDLGGAADGGLGH
jgi:DNA-binding CsgD family transcriptional regulator